MGEFALEDFFFLVKFEVALVGIFEFEGAVLWVGEGLERGEFGNGDEGDKST